MKQADNPSQTSLDFLFADLCGLATFIQLLLEMPCALWAAKDRTEVGSWEKPRYFPQKKCTAFTVRRTILPPGALGREAQTDADQAIFKKGSQINLKAGRWLQQQADKHSKMLLSLIFTSPVWELWRAEERTGLPVCHTTGTTMGKIILILRSF